MQVVTNAHPDYDYVNIAKTVKEVYAILVTSNLERKRTLRLVELTGSEYQNQSQIARYDSGLNFTKEVKQFHKDVEKYPNLYQLVKSTQKVSCAKGETE
jgi:hypothetical protein